MFLALTLTQRCDGVPEGVTSPDESQVAVIFADAGMLQLRDEEEEATPEQTPEDATKPDNQQAKQTPEGLASLLHAEEADAEKEQGEDPDQEEKPSGRHWHEMKVGLVVRMDSNQSETDPCPEIPDTFVDAQRVARIVRGMKKSAALQAEDQSEEVGAEGDPENEQDLEEVFYEGPKLTNRQVVASRRSWPLFGALLACAAWLAGFALAPRKAFVADGARAIWRVWKRRFSSYVPILDFIHAMTYVYAAAKAVGEEAGNGWGLYAEWIRWMWQGKVDLVIQKLKEWQEKKGKPEKGESKSSRRSVVARTVGYLVNNAGKMKYDDYRKKGLPIMSSLVESMVKQIGRRVKGTEKFWTEEGAEAILQLRADYLSDGDVMEGFWQRRQAAATGQRSYRSRS